MKILLFFAAFCLGIGLITPAQAGGLYLREYGQPAQGTAGAGANVLSRDASTAYQNPAGVFNLKDSEWMVTGIALDSSSKFSADSDNTIIGNNGGDAGDTLFGGALFHTRRLSDQWGLAFALNSVAGSGLEYDDEFVGRYTGQQTELLTVTFTPSVAYKVNDELSVAFGLPVLYGQLELEAALPPLIGPATPERDGLAKIDDGDDYDVTFSASALWQASDDWRFAVNYLGESELDFDSDLAITLPGAGSGVTLDNISANVEIAFPQVLSVSALHEVNEKLSLMTRLSWEEWSRLDRVPITTNSGGSAIPLDWDDVWSISAGLRYRTGKKWTYYGGIAYDTDPAEPETRVAVLPADRQWRLAGGFTYEIDENREWGVSLTYVDLGDADTRQVLEVGQYSGKYSTNRIWIVGLNFAWQ